MRKNTKRALILSALSLLLCVSMLVGTTFAWFTDNTSTAVNTIQAGTLNIDIQDNSGTSLDKGTLSFVNDEGTVLDAEKILWEPGCTYILQNAKLVNLGNLAAKFKVSIGGLTGDTVLANVIDVEINGVAKGTLAELMADPDGAAYGQLMPQGQEGDSVSIGTISLHMQETAGNEYQGKTLSGIAITVQATQATVESDSYGNQYDKNATYDVTSAAEAVEAMKTEGAVVSLAGNIGDLKIPAEAKNVTIIGGDATVGTITIAEGAENITFVDMASLRVIADQSTNESFGTITVQNSTFENTGFLVKGNSATDFVVENCKFVGSSRIYDNYAGFDTVIIRNCEFTGQTDGPILICGHSNSGRFVNSMTVENCTFTNVNKNYIARVQAMGNNGTFTFRNNTITSWPQAATGRVPVSVDNKNNVTVTFVIEGNTLNGAAYNDYTSN